MSRPISARVAKKVNMKSLTPPKEFRQITPTNVVIDASKQGTEFEFNKAFGFGQLEIESFIKNERMLYHIPYKSLPGHIASLIRGESFSIEPVFVPPAVAGESGSGWYLGVLAKKHNEMVTTDIPGAMSRIGTTFWVSEAFRVVGVESTDNETGHVLLEYFDGRNNKAVFIDNPKEFEACHKRIRLSMKEHPQYAQFDAILDGKRFSIWDGPESLNDWFSPQQMPRWASRANVRVVGAELRTTQQNIGLSWWSALKSRIKRRLKNEKVPPYMEHLCLCLKLKTELN